MGRRDHSGGVNEAHSLISRLFRNEHSVPTMRPREGEHFRGEFLWFQYEEHRGGEEFPVNATPSPTAATRTAEFRHSGNIPLPSACRYVRAPRTFSRPRSPAPAISRTIPRRPES